MILNTPNLTRREKHSEKNLDLLREKKNLFSENQGKSEESKKKKKGKNIHIFTKVSLVGVSKKNVLFKRVYIGLVHRRRKERYTQILARNTRERITTAFRRSYSPVVVPSFRFRVPAFVHRNERVFESVAGWVAQLWRNIRKRFPGSERSPLLSFPLSRSSFHDDTVKIAIAPWKTILFAGQGGEEGEIRPLLNVICTNREKKNGLILYINQLEGYCRSYRFLFEYLITFNPSFYSSYIKQLKISELLTNFLRINVL